MFKILSDAEHEFHQRRSYGTQLLEKASSVDSKEQEDIFLLTLVEPLIRSLIKESLANVIIIVSKETLKCG